MSPTPSSPPPAAGPPTRPGAAGGAGRPADFARRQRQVRAAFLFRVYELADANVHTQIAVKDVLQTLPLTEPETDASLQFLTDAGLIRPHFTWGRQKGFSITLTPAGITAAEQIVDDWRTGVLDPLPQRAATPFERYPAVPDLRFTDALYLGAGWTQDGKRPGDHAEPLDLEYRERPHCIVPARQVGRNLAVFGAVGSGKTAYVVLPLLEQMLAKYPDVPRGARASLPERWVPRTVNERPLESRSLAKRQLVVGLPAAYADATAAGDDAIADRAAAEGAAADPAQAHRDRRWAVIALDARDEFAESLTQACRAYGRAEDVLVLRPGGGRGGVDRGAPEGPALTYNPLAAFDHPLVAAEAFLDACEWARGGPARTRAADLPRWDVTAYYRTSLSALLASCLAVHRACEVVGPTRAASADPDASEDQGAPAPEPTTFRHLERLVRTESLRAAMTAEAATILRAAEDAGRRATDRVEPPADQPDVVAAVRAAGLVGPSIGALQQAVEFLRDWDDVDMAPETKRAVQETLLALLRPFREPALEAFCAPTGRATFPGFARVVDEGRVVVASLPLYEYGTTARVLYALLLADAAQAIRGRITRELAAEQVGDAAAPRAGDGPTRGRMVGVVVDDAVAAAPALANLATVSRSLRACVVVAAHSARALLDADRGAGQMLLDNCLTRVSMTVPNREAALVEARAHGPADDDAWVPGRRPRDPDDDEDAWRGARGGEASPPAAPFRPARFLGLTIGQMVASVANAGGRRPARLIARPTPAELPEDV